jgi:hypothetical protein
MPSTSLLLSTPGGLLGFEERLGLFSGQTLTAFQLNGAALNLLVDSGTILLKPILLATSSALAKTPEAAFE